MRWGAFNAAPDASTANWAFRVWTAISRSRSRITNSSAVTVSGAEGITGARAHPASRTRPSPVLKKVRVRLGEHRIQGLSHFRHPDELHGLDRRHLLQIALRQQAAPEAQLGRRRGMGKLVGETNACNSMRIGRVPSRLATTTEPVAFCGRSDRNQADGLATSLSPASVISNTPISLVEPNRFFTARRIRYA